MSVSLREKFYGTIVGAYMGSAMGVPVEALTHEEIVKKHGYVDRLLTVEFPPGWVREPGTTEDGIERQKLMIHAIVEKGDRVNAEDVKKAWIKHMNPKAPGVISEPFEAILLRLAQSGVHGKEIGRYCDYSGLNSFSRACHPIGLINAGNIQTAIDDIYEVGQLYQAPFSSGLKWACVTGVSIAAATKPDATVDSVISAIYDNCDKDLVVREIDRELNATKGFDNIHDMSNYFDTVYQGKGIPYHVSYACEVVTKAVCIFKMVEGNTKEAMLAGTNIGRDTDCISAIAAGISGALKGAGSVPEEWVKQVDYAATLNPFTNTQITMRETSDGLYDAFINRMRNMKGYIESMAVI